jgi:hypothetical protein
MRHITLLALAAVLALPLQAQVIFQSGFEDWTGNIPDGWFGVRTNIAASAVSQANVNPHTGDYAVRLENTLTNTSDHRRFTTQDLTVTASTTYDVSFWVRGQGDVRLGLYDGRAGNGYAPYTAYTTINNDNTWQQVTLSITAAVDATNAQFILSVKSTVAPEHLVVDDVNIEAQSVNPPVDATIQEIQETTNPGGASPLVGTVVNTSGVVTAIVPGSNPGFFIQDGTGPWSGIYVFFSPTGLQRGDRVNVTGTVTEFNGQTQIAGVTSVEVTATGVLVGTTTATTAQANTEPYESVLITLNAATCTAAGSFGQFTVNDGSGPTLVDDVIYAHPFAVGQVYNITGVLQYAFNEWRTLPRDVNDVSLVTGIAERDAAAITVHPNPATDMLVVELPALTGRTEFQLFDATGRLVLERTLTTTREAIAVATLPTGAYTARIGTATARVLVAR